MLTNVEDAKIAKKERRDMVFGVISHVVLIGTLLFFVFRDPSVWSALSSRQSKLFLVFICYVFSIVIFGGVYYMIYRRRQESYHFAADINATQRLNLLNQLKVEFSERDFALQHLTRAIEGISDGRFDFVKYDSERFLVNPDHHELLRPFLERALTSTKVNVTRDGVYHVKNAVAAGRGGYIAYHIVDPSCGRSYTFRGDWGGELDDYKAEYKECTKRIGELSKKIYRFEAGVLDVWSFVDFLYFSTITQTTVGYGDILPNSRAVRVCVILQILWGYYLIAVSVNSVLS